MGNIIDEYNTIFIHIPKNAGTSILNAFGVKNANHEKWYFYKKNYPKKWGAYLRFGVVRNPWDRLVSNYEYAKLEKSYWHSADANAIYGKHKDYELLKNKSFDEAIWLLKKNPRLFKHQGWGNQFSYLYDKKLMPQAKVLRFENIEAEFNEIFPLLKLPKTNVSRTSNDYKQYYDKKTIQLVESIYKTDIKLFKYTY